MLKISFLLCIIASSAKTQQLKSHVILTDTISVSDKIIYNARMIGTQNENFLYATCNDTQQQRHCDFIMQKEAKKLTCPVNIAPDDPAKQRLSELIIYPLNDDKVVITWSNDRWQDTQFKILDMSSCKLLDVTLPTNQVIYTTVYDDSVEIGLWNATYCNSTICKIAVNADGKMISGPTPILENVNVTYIEPMGPVNEHAPEQGFYADVGSDGEETARGRHHFYEIIGSGDSVHIASIDRIKYGRSSNAHNLFSICHAIGEANTTIACHQYDHSAKKRFSAKIEFQDGKSQRWLQPHNLKNGGLLLVSGKQSDLDAKRFDAFGITKIRHDGEVDGEKPTTEVDNLNFTCPGIKSMNVNVLERKAGEICAYFTCGRAGKDDAGQKTDTLQLALICLSKA